MMKKVINFTCLALLCAWLAGCSSNNPVVNNPLLLAPMLYSPADGSKGTDTAPGLTWTKVTDAAMYDVQVSKTTSFAIIVFADSMIVDDSLLITRTAWNLSPNTSYYWRTRAKNSNGRSSWTSPWQFSTSIVAPVLKTPGNAVLSQPSTVTLSWDTVAGTLPAKYRLQVSTSNNFTSTIVDDSTLTLCTKTISSLSNSTTYYWRVSAKSSAGVSSWSNVWNFSTVLFTPVTPVLISPANGAIASPTFTWNIVPGAATYHLQVSTDSSFSSTIVDISLLTGSSKTINNLVLNTQYYWRLAAGNSVGISAWSGVWSFSTAPPVTVTDADGNVYTTVTIGTQTWTVENLKTTKYNDGTAIPQITDDTTWWNLTTPGFCWYDNDAATYKTTYGALYNWNAVNTGKLAPAGWHVPTDAEWTTLKTYLIAYGYNYDATTTDNLIGKALASPTNWNTSSTIGNIGNNVSTNNRSGFSALPGGFRIYNGTFSGIGDGGYWWSATEGSTSIAYFYSLKYYSNSLYGDSYGKNCGYSVRLVRD